MNVFFGGCREIYGIIFGDEGKKRRSAGKVSSSRRWCTVIDLLFNKTSSLGYYIERYSDEEEGCYIFAPLPR